MSAPAVNVSAMRKASRDRRVAELRDGLRQRSTRIESARAYKRNEKHRKAGW